MTKIDIFSGFLGAGKTTLIKKLIAEAYSGEKLVLIENEFGEINIDGGFLKESGIEISEMSAGCICCSLVGDFNKALKEVVAQFHPDRILIEPSGVGKLSDVIVAVQRTVDECPELKLNSYVTVADASKVKVYMKNFGEFYNNQIEAAGTIILSRTQKLSQEKLEVTKGDCDANLLEREVTLTLAKMALEKYEKGDYPQQAREYETDIAIADEEMKRAAEKLEWSQRLAKEGFLTRTELQADELALRQKEIKLEMARTKMNVLTNYTVIQQRATHESDVRKATRALARTKWQNKSLIRQVETEIIQRTRERDRATNRLAELNFQISKSKIYAPTNGVILYASTVQIARRRYWIRPLAVGETAVQRQELIYIPLDAGMIVELMVPEASLNKLETGMPANVRVDAFPDRIFHGRLTKIGILPDGQSASLNPDLKMYKCELECDFSDVVIRPGMSCDIELVKHAYDKVLYCPMQCVTRVNGVPCVYVQEGREWVARPVEVGLDNNRMIHLVSGVEKGDVIMMAPPVRESKDAGQKDAPPKTAKPADTRH